jgi:hypothetical protein
VLLLPRIWGKQSSTHDSRSWIWTRGGHSPRGCRGQVVRRGLGHWKRQRQGEWESRRSRAGLASWPRLLLQGHLRPSLTRLPAGIQAVDMAPSLCFLWCRRGRVSCRRESSQAYWLPRVGRRLRVRVRECVGPRVGEATGLANVATSGPWMAS